MQSLPELLDSFYSHGDKTALVYRTGVRRYCYSYRWLADNSLRMAAWLGTMGIGPGDRVLLWGPNSPWWSVAFWGVIARGAVAVPVDFMSGRDRAATIARLTDARLTLQSRFKIEGLPGQPLYLEDLEFLLPQMEPLSRLHTAAPDDTAQLIYTSGTTGNPKGVILTHRNLTANLSQVSRHIPVVESKFTFLSLLPLSHMFEQMCGFFTPLAKGCSIVYLRTLKPGSILEALAEENVAVVIAVPRLLQLLRTSIEREVASRGLTEPFSLLMRRSASLSPSMRKALFFPIRRKFGRNFTLFVSGGAPLDPDLFLFWQRLGFTVIEGYGLTECSPVLAANTVELQVPGAVGKPLPEVELKLQEGEVLARGPNISPGYYQNEVATSEAFTSDRWFRTGDLGEFGPEGYLHIKGRSKELIVTGAGINVFPDELEPLLNGAAGVREACVIGLDRGHGEEVHAVIIPDGSGRSGEDIIREVNARLDDLHQITGYSLWPDAEFPKTTTLKIRKFQVKEQVRAGRRHEDSAGTADRLTMLVAKVTGAPVQEIKNDARLVTDLGLTSIGRLELVNYLEQEFRLDMEDSLIGPETRVSQLRGMVERREKYEQKEHFRFWTNSRPITIFRMMCDLLLNYPVFRYYARLEVRGSEHLREFPGPVLFIANHTSFADQPAVMFALPANIRYRTATAAWAEFFFKNFRNPLQHAWKWLTYQYGSMALNLFPLSQSGGFRSALRFMGRLVDHGRNILVFPEGERSRDGRLLPFQLGLGIMVKELGVPVVPVRITGLTHVLPRGARWPRRGVVTVAFGSPLRFGQESVEEVVEKARQAVAALPEG